jgi:hypothetical protein
MGVGIDATNFTNKTQSMKSTKTKTDSKQQKQQKKKMLLTTLAVGAAGVLGYYGWQYHKKQKAQKAGGVEDVLKEATPPPIPYPTHPSMPDTPINIKPSVTATPKHRPFVTKPVYTDTPKEVAEFPLKKGSKGEKVKALQEALIQKYGKVIMPRYGADGFFGAEMILALKKLKLPLVITETFYHVLVQGHTATKNTTGQKLHEAAIKQDFKTAIGLLKTIKTKEQYQEIGDQFKANRINGVRQTLVNGMLNSFTKAEQQQAIRFEFIRMGLQYDGNKWSLSGVAGLPIMTTSNTVVWVNAQKGINVPSKMILGNEVSKRLDYTLFENNGNYYLVQTSCVQYV